MNLYLAHYGIKRRSGRYPWGSGKRPFQSGKGNSRPVHTTRSSNKLAGIAESVKYEIKDDKGKTISEASLYDFDIKNFDFLLLADVETSKEHRNQGLASSILNKAYEDAKDKGKGVYLVVKETNDNAIKFYEGLNFEKLKPQDIDGENYLVMAKGDQDLSILKKMNFS